MSTHLVIITPIAVVTAIRAGATNGAASATHANAQRLHGLPGSQQRHARASNALLRLDQGLLALLHGFLRGS